MHRRKRSRRKSNARTRPCVRSHGFRVTGDLLCRLLDAPGECPRQHCSAIRAGWDPQTFEQEFDTVQKGGPHSQITITSPLFYFFMLQPGPVHSLPWQLLVDNQSPTRWFLRNPGRVNDCLQTLAIIYLRALLVGGYRTPPRAHPNNVVF